MPASEPTDRQVRAGVYRIARAYLEVERGLRPPDHLERFLTDAEYRRHRAEAHHPATRTREPVLPTDIGRIHLDRHLPGQITATIPTRETGEHWGALVLHFARNHTGRWRIDQLERLQRPSVAREAPQRPAEVKTLGDLIADLESQLRLVDAAHRATTTRLRELRRAGAQPDQTRDLRSQQKTWKRIRSELDAELRDLRNTLDLRDSLAEVDRRPLRDATQLDDRQLDALLGPVPDDDWCRRLRDGLIDEIHTYRRRWGITDTRNVLGPTPDDPNHERDRDELATTLRAAARSLGAGTHLRGRTAELKGRGQPHDHGVAAER